MDKFTDKLIYDRPAIPTGEMLSIVFGYTWEELKEAERWTPESREENKKKVAKAKKAEGIHLVSEPYGYSPPVVISPAKPKRKKLSGKELKELKQKNKRLVAVGTAFRKFKQWVGITFHDDTTGRYLANEYPTQEFSRWVVENNILKELNKLGISTTPRARRFIGFVEKEQANSKQKARPPSPETRRAKMNTLHCEALKIMKKLHRKGKPFTYKDILCGSDWIEALRVSTLLSDEKPSMSTIKRWLTEFKKTI